MPTGRDGSIRLFAFAGIDVFLHWSWFLVAVYEIQSRSGRYSSILWNILEYLALFLIVLLHEFGHALACRQVGGNANRIVLWPLGGVAYVDPPPRPGATLWSIAAGPLVNVALVPVFLVTLSACRSAGVTSTAPDLFRLLRSIAWINGGLLIFNILPIYPLDGGQILRSLLWFVLGRARSLMTAAILGLLGGRCIHRTRSLETRPVVGSNRPLHGNELLGWVQERPNAVAHGKTSTTRGIYLSDVQNCSASWSGLEVRSVRPVLRSFRNGRRLSLLSYAIPHNTVPRLRSPACNPRMGFGLDRGPAVLIRCHSYESNPPDSHSGNLQPVRSNKSLLCPTSAFSIGWAQTLALSFRVPSRR
jgi:Zn-dependent protease